MRNKKLCVVGGDGIGPGVTSAAVKVLLAAAPDIEISYAEAGWGTFQETGDSVPAQTLTAIKESGAALFGAVSSPSRKVDGYRSAILQIRQSLDLYCNLRPVKSSWSINHSEDVELVVVRENSEGLYSGREERRVDWAIAEKVVTKSASIRIAEMAGRAAEEYGMDQITIVHKANVLPISDGLFRDSIRERLQSRFPNLSINEGLVDIVAHNLVAQPEKFQVLVTTNLYGDILSDLAAWWCGGMGRAPSLNLGAKYAVAEPVHGSAPDIAGLGIADPSATILSLALLSRHYWQDSKLADRLEQATIKTIHDNSRDEFRTKEFADAVVLNIDQANCVSQ